MRLRRKNRILAVWTCYRALRGLGCFGRLACARMAASNLWAK